MSKIIIFTTFEKEIFCYFFYFIDFFPLKCLLSFHFRK